MSTFYYAAQQHTKSNKNEKIRKYVHHVCTTYVYSTLQRITGQLDIKRNDF